MKKALRYQDIELHYDVTGEGSPLILMHGWGCNSSTVASIAAVASKTHTVYNVDFPGFGASTEPSQVWGVEEYTRVIEELAKAEQMHAPALIGHSFGGRVGILYASRNEVSKLILVDAAGIKPKRKLSYYYKVYTYKMMRRIAELTMSKDKAQRFLERQRAKRGSSDYANSTPMMRAILSKVVNEDLKSALPSIKAPTLLIWGEDDTATPLSDAKLMSQLIPDAGLVAFTHCGHYSFLDNPGQFSAVLHNFLSH